MHARILTIGKPVHGALRYFKTVDDYIFNRQADKLYMCNIAQIVNVLQAVLMTDGPEG